MSPVNAMPRNPMREKMERGELAVGMIARLVRGVEVAAIARTAGFDTLFIDLEHNSFTLESVSQICLAANAYVVDQSYDQDDQTQAISFASFIDTLATDLRADGRLDGIEASSSVFVGVEVA